MKTAACSESRESAAGAGRHPGPFGDGCAHSDR